MTVKGARPCCIRQSKISGLPPPDTAVAAEAGRAPPGTCDGRFFFFLVFFFEDDAAAAAPIGAPGAAVVAPGRGGGGGGTARVEDSPEQEAHASQSHRLVAHQPVRRNTGRRRRAPENREAQVRCARPDQSRVACHIALGHKKGTVWVGGTRKGGSVQDKNESASDAGRC